MTFLDELAERFKTDKAPSFHNYTRWYNKYFEEIRKSPMYILEIGVHEGGSLRMWQDYFPTSWIYGIDIDPKCMFTSNRIVTKVRNQVDVQHLEEMKRWPGKEGWNIIIDDGSHRNFDQIFTFMQLWPSLAKGGIYVVEDVCTSYMKEYTQDGHETFVDFSHTAINMLNLSNFVNSRKSKMMLYGDRKVAMSCIPEKDLESICDIERDIEYIHYYKNIVFFGKMS